MPIQYDTVVVGGGHNGLVAAFYLARAGKKVLVLERRSLIGGAAVTEELFPGYRVSSCSYVLWMLQPKVRTDMRLNERGLRWHSLEPWQLNPYRDGTHLQWFGDPDKTRASIAKISPADAKGWDHWNDFWDHAARILHPFLLTEPPTMDEIHSHAKEIGEDKTLDKVLNSSIADICEEFLTDTRVMAALVQVEDIGDPWYPGSAWLETYYQTPRFFDYGYAVVEGGMGRVTQLMAQACYDVGVHIRTDAKISSISTDDNGRVTGVVVNDDWEVQTNRVVVNADPKQTFQKLLQPDQVPAEFSSYIDGLTSQTGYYKFHSVLNELPDVSRYLGDTATKDDVAYIQIAPGLEWYKKTIDQCNAGQIPTEPILHLQFPSLHDKTLTNEDGHILSIWGLYAPPSLAEGTWPERREEAENLIIDYVTEYIPNFRSSIRHSMLYTPWDLEQNKYLPGGQFRHIDVMPDRQFLTGRVPYKTPVPGLWMCGASTHPGGEVTGANGHNCANAILREEGLST
jgi:phytoene dehydrogenase-like protein